MLTGSGDPGGQSGLRRSLKAADPGAASVAAVSMADFGRGDRVGRAARASLVLALGGLGLAACATAPSSRPGLSSLGAPSDDTTSSARPYAGGSGGGGLHGTDKPYQINGIWYYPHAQPDYDVVGYASWYGPGFSAKRTADGEVFDEFGLTAAHKTLPLPSIIEVTNLDNGRSIKLRLNDRGPFVDERVLDVSRAAAEQLGFARQGLARVRVRYVGAAPPLAASVTYAAADPMNPPPRRALTGAALGGATAAAAALAAGGTATSAATATTGTVLASAALPTVSRRPSGAVQEQALPPLNAYGSPAAPIALAAYRAPPPPAPTDPSRYAEASVALTAGDLAPTAQAAPAMASQAVYAPVVDTAGARWSPPAGDPPDSLASGVSAPPRPVEMASLAPAAAPLPLYAPPPARAYAASNAGAAIGLEGYSVQAGAFSSRGNAERAAAQLGASAAIRPVDRGGLTLYRVVLAGYPSPGAAEAARAQAVAAGFPDARVVSAQ